MINFIFSIFISCVLSYSSPDSVPPFILKPLPKYFEYGDFSAIDLERDLFPLEEYQYHLVKNESEISKNSLKFYELGGDGMYSYSCYITYPSSKQFTVKKDDIDMFWKTMADVPCISLFDYDPLGWSYEVCPLRSARQLRISKQKIFLDSEEDIIRKDSDIYNALNDLLGSVALSALNASLKKSGKVNEKNRKFEVKDVVVVKYDIGFSQFDSPLLSAFDAEANFLALEENFTGGTICEANGLPRSGRVRYECTPDKEEDHIISVIEVDICKYFIRIGSGRACGILERKEKDKKIECVRKKSIQ